MKPTREPDGHIISIRGNSKKKKNEKNILKNGVRFAASEESRFRATGIMTDVNNKDTTQPMWSYGGML